MYLKTIITKVSSWAIVAFKGSVALCYLSYSHSSHLQACDHTAATVNYGSPS